ncbi:MAG: hypothetical protein JSR15_06630 [Proteobacteria bacterium]|nr:hypothetical protein [Pseudomonadota bacterium]
MTETRRRPTPCLMIASLALCAAALLAGCSHVRKLEPSNWHAHWPWHHAPPAPEPPVVELMVDAAAGASAPELAQAWDRNTLRVSLERLAGNGELTLHPVQGHGWPIRLEFAVQPGSFQQLELRGDQRVILVVPATGGVAVLPVPQGLYSSSTRELTLRYGSAAP